MATKVTQKSLEEALETYSNLIEVYPDNEAYLQRYADMLQQMGREATAIATLQHLHDIIAQRSEKEATAFAKKHPQIGRISLEEIFDAQDNHITTGKVIFELLGNIWLRLHRQKLKEGQVIYRGAELSDSLTLVLDGHVDMYAVRGDNTRILLESVGMYDVLGEQTFINPANVNIDAFVSSETATIVRVPRKKLLQMVEANKHLATMLSQRALFRSHTRIIATHPVFKALPLKLCKYLARNLTRHTIGAQSMVATLEQPIDGVDIILSGEACYLAKNKEGKVFRLPPLQQRSLIGDTTLKGNKARHTNEVLANSKVSTAHISYQHLLNISTAFPPLLERLIKHAEQQQQQTIQALSQLKDA